MRARITVASPWNGTINKAMLIFLCRSIFQPCSKNYSILPRRNRNMLRTSGLNQYMVAVSKWHRLTNPNRSHLKESAESNRLLVPSCTTHEPSIQPCSHPSNERDKENSLRQHRSTCTFHNQCQNRRSHIGHFVPP